MAAKLIPFSARKGTFTYATSAVSITDSAALDTFFGSGTEFSGAIKDFTITPPEGDVEVTSFAGETDSGFQNQRYDEKAYTDAMVEGTMIVDDVKYLEELAGGSGTSISTTHTRWQFGDGNRVEDGAILINCDNGTDEFSVVLDNIIITKVGDISMTDTEGHWEMGFSGKCLAEDFYLERNGQD